MGYSKQMLDCFSCPSCGQGELIEEQAGKLELNCSSCGQIFPEYSSITWLLAFAEQSKQEWRARFNHLNAQTEVEVERLKLELRNENLLETTKNRLRRILQAKIEHNKEVQKIMLPISKSNNMTIDQANAMQVKLPETQQLMGYYHNVLRDWSFGQEENELSASLIVKCLGENQNLGKSLVLGAGACKLAHDLYTRVENEFMFALDINPFLLYVAQKVLDGKSITLYEFPIAPIKLEESAVKHRIKHEKQDTKNFKLLMADGLNPPFKAEQFDSLITPWFIDIVPQQLDEQLLVYNQLLKKGARWINFGPLAFNYQSFQRCYSSEEVVELAQTCGFKIEQIHEQSIPYLNSPSSGQKRKERVICFSAVKVESKSAPKKKSYLPSWLSDTSKQVEAFTSFEQKKQVHENLAQIFRELESEPSIDQLAERLSESFGIAPDALRVMLSGLLSKFYEEAQSGKKF